MFTCIIIIPTLLLYNIANCGHPETESYYSVNDSRSVPNIEDYDGLPVEGTTVTFSCPPGLVLTGPSSVTCTGNGRWQPDPSGLYNAMTITLLCVVKYNL